MSSGSRKRILVISRQFPPEVGGAGTYAQNIALALSGAGHRVSVLSVTARGRRLIETTSDELLLNRGIESIRRVSFLPKLYLPLLSLAGRNATKSGGYDVVLVADSGAQKALSLFPWFGGTPIWTVFHGSEMISYFDQPSVFFRLFGAQKRMIRFLQGVTGCIAISEYLRQTIVAKQPFLKEKIFTIRHGIDVDDFSGVLALSKTQVRRSLGLDRDKKIILAAGRLLRSKGQDTLIRAFPRISRQCPEAQLVLLGDGPDEGYLRDLIGKLGLDKRVLLLRGVPNTEMKMYYRAADLFVQLSRISSEAFGLVYIEANACGVPVIASPVGGVPEAVAEGISGRLVDSSESMLAENVLSMICDESLQATMAKSGLERVQREFSLPAMASNTERLLFAAYEGNEKSLR